ncbi:hypothetical protein GGF50DRAFT_121515 [Schizophyllum commune]
MSGECGCILRRAIQDVAGTVSRSYRVLGLHASSARSGARSRGRRGAPPRALKLIGKTPRVRVQTQKYRILTPNAPRPARESLAERREPINTGEGGGAERRLVHFVQANAPDASCARFRIPSAPPDAKISHFDAKCAEVRAGGPSGPLR